MRIFLILLSTCVALSTSQCDSAYGTYLNCIKGELDKNYQSLETDFREGYIDLCMNCFTNEQGQLSQKCYIKGRDVFGLAFTAEGPLRQCPMCQTVARVIEKLFTSPDVNPATMKCIRGNVTEAIGKEIGACIKGKISSFNMPALPDFDEASHPYRKDMVSTTSAFIVASAGLQRCQANQNRRDDNRRTKRGAFDTTNTCMNEREVDGKPIWASHCNVMGSCRRPIAGSCKETFGQVETAACNCIEEKRQKINGIIVGAADKIKAVILETAAKPGDTCTTSEADPELKLQNYKECRCKKIINGVIDENSSGNVDIRDYFRRAVGCTSISEEQREQFTIDKLIDMGCRRVGRPGDSGQAGAKELVIGVDFILKLFDALVARVTRFCPGAHCPNPA
jgi:hypothetical protein